MKGLGRGSFFPLTPDPSPPRRGRGEIIACPSPKKNLWIKGAVPGRDRLRAGRLSGFLISIFSAFVLGNALASAGTPRNELLRLVPEDVGFCVLIEDLSGHGNALVNSPFLKLFLASPAGAKVAHGEEAQKLSLVDEFLQKKLHLNAMQLRDEILGDALVLAYRPGPVEQPEQEQGLFLIRARNSKLLADLIDRLNEIQKKSGDLQGLEECTYHDKKYQRRVEKKATNYYYLHGPVLAFANEERILHELIDLDGKTSSAAEPFIARQLAMLGPKKPLAALWLNPRAFEKALQKKADAAQGTQAASLKTLLKYWKAVEGVVFAITLQEDFGVSVAVRSRVELLPASARRFLSTAAERTDLWERVPKDAILAVGGRINVAALLEVLGEFMTEEARGSVRTVAEGSLGAVFGKDALKGILPQIGPDWVCFMVAPPPADKNWFPRCLAAIRVGPGKGEAPAGTALGNALNSLATLAVFSVNGGHPGALSLNSTMQGKVEVKYVVNDEDFPPGLQPAFALNEGHLLLASSPEAISSFSPTPAPSEKSYPAETPILRFSFRELARFIKERRELLVAFLAKKNQLSPEATSQGLDQFLAAIEFLDAIEINQRCEPGQVIFSLRLRTAQPLK
ncbi:MAG TPA: hypothetical protein VK395_14610 [Gemmataceae bacterium]|nr:hypothetical protein [Gemmataceae bacterium]